MSADIDAMVANMNAALDAYEKDKDEAALTKAAEEFQAKAQEFQTKYANLDSSKFTEADQNYLMEHMTPFLQLLERFPQTEKRAEILSVLRRNADRICETDRVNRYDPSVRPAYEVCLTGAEAVAFRLGAKLRKLKGRAS